MIIRFKASLFLVGVKTDAQYDKDTQESRTLFEKPVDGPNSKEISSSSVPIDSIKIGSRFRKDLGDIALLAENIREIGLLQPIVINQNHELISGLRRIEAFKLSEIPAHIVNLDDTRPVFIGYIVTIHEIHVISFPLLY
ncbi:MAG TPA: ParB N-terminal domain-containing protein [Candidatus Bathyarchaeia archaeon]|nr:ParB N-terminal domain-containing protein [Candidatus Bathyarchaeia archaeon]